MRREVASPRDMIRLNSLRMPHLQPDPRDTAEQRHHEAVQRRHRARAADDAPAWIEAALDCGDALFELEQYGLAVKLFREAADIIRSRGQRADLLARSLGMAGRALQRLRRWDEALPCYRQAAEAAAAAGQAAQQLRWLLKEASSALDMGAVDAKQVERGAQLLNAAIATGRKLLAAGQPVAEPLADALLRLAGLESTGSEQADALADEALAMLADLPPGRAHFRAAINRGGHFVQRDQYELAQTWFEEALEIGRAIGADAQELQPLLLSIAQSLRHANEPLRAGELLTAHLPAPTQPRTRHEFLKAAVDHFFAARAWDPMRSACVAMIDLGYDQRAGWRHHEQLLLSIACRGLAQYNAALQALAASLAFAQAWGSPEAIAKARGQTAIVLLDQGHFAEALPIAQALWDEGRRDRLSALTLLRARIGSGDLDGAAALAQQFEADSGDALAAAELRALLADAGRGDPRAAWYAFGAAGRRNRAVEARALTRLIALNEPGSAERFEQARHRLRLLDHARARVGDLFSDASWRAAFEEADEFPLWLDEFLVEARRAGNDEAAIYELERFRAQTLVNLLAERRALWSGAALDRGRLKDEFTARWRRAQFRCRALAARGASWRERRAQAEESERLRVQALSAGGMIHIAPAEQGRHFPDDLAALLGEHRLAADEALLFAHALPDGLALWAKHASGATRRTLLPGFGREPVRAMRESLRGIAQPDAPPLELPAVLARIDALWGTPLASWLAEAGVRRAFVCTGTELAALPLDCCDSLLADGAPELVLLPSGAALGFARAARRPQSTRLLALTQEDRDRDAAAILQRARGRTLVVADPTRELEFVPLEAAVVACAHHGRTLETIDAARIDPAALARACGEVEVLHFAGHGEFDDASPYASGLSIGPRGGVGALWTNADIFGDVNAPGARLAVLSGCETGQTQPNLVSEEVSLPAAFIAAGYTAVVASRWAVDDLATTLLMGEFHRRWMAGETSVAAALAGSRRWLRDLTQAQALALLDALPAAIAWALPERAERCGALCAAARDVLVRQGEHPFDDPLHWAAFHVAGDGAIHADPGA